MLAGFCMASMEDAMTLQQKSTNADRRALRPRPFAKAYGLSDRLVYQLLREGKLPAIQVNDRWLILVKEFEAQAVKPSSAEGGENA